MPLLGAGPSDMPSGEWRKSSYSYVNGNCTEVAIDVNGLIKVRDSMNPQGSVLTFGRVPWDAFVGGIGSGGYGWRQVPFS